jgi:hypothetical protein
MRLELNNILNLQQKISPLAAFSFMILLSCLVAWFTLSKADEVIKSAQYSPAFNINVRANINGLNNKTDVHVR